MGVSRFSNRDTKLAFLGDDRRYIPITSLSLHFDILYPAYR